MSWLIPRDELTSDQLRAIEADANEHRVILGCAGSGKTQVLLHRAHYLRELIGTPPDRYHIFVYTNVLRHYIQSALSLLNLPDPTVSTFDAWCVEFYKSTINKHIPWDKESHQPNFDAVRSGVLDKLSSGTLQLPIFDFIMVDESQDLNEVTLNILTRISRHITLCMDPRQQIYEQGSTKEVILRQLGIGTKNTVLLEAFRCCPFIVKVAAEFLDDPEERKQFIQRSRTTQTERETPLLYYAANFDDEVRRLAEIVRTRQAKGDRIAVLFPENRKVYGFANALREAGLEVETPKRDRATGTFAELNFNSDLPKVLTYYSAKGLTFDTIIMPRLVPNSFHNVSAERLHRLLFVAITRATKWVYLSTISSERFDPLNKLQGLKDRGELSIQDAGMTGKPDRTATQEDVLDIL